jgi:adenosyl cobinamide kinase/adenosyl cobinamide phosphate guanylyltransferase
LWPNFRQLRILSIEEQEETKSDVRNLIEEFKRDEELGSTAVTSGNFCEESVSDSYQHTSKKPKIWISVCSKTQLKSQKVKNMKSRNVCILMQVMLNLMTYVTGGKTMYRNSNTYQELTDMFFVYLPPVQAAKKI